MSDIPDGFDLYIGGGVGAQYDLTNDMIAIDHFGIKDYKIFDATTKDVPDDADPGYIPKNIGIMNTDTLTNLENEVSRYSNVLLKMDIENCEWNWINYTSYSTLMKFKQIAIEMHFAGLPEDCGDSDVTMTEKIAAVIKLTKTHRMVHAHGNNNVRAVLEIGDYRVPMVSEFTFVRRDYSTDEFSITKLPVPGLDFKNDHLLPDVDFLNIHME
jgi:hypothetical protein